MPRWLTAQLKFTKGFCVTRALVTCPGPTTAVITLFLFREIPLVQILRLLGFFVLAVLHCIVNVAERGLDRIWLRKVQWEERYEGVIFDLWKVRPVSLLVSSNSGKEIDPLVEQWPD